MQKEGIKLLGYMGTWCVIDECVFEDETHYLLESEQHGDEIPCLIAKVFIDGKLRVFIDDVQNGFYELWD
jgi:hypothetical protein